MYNNFQKHLSDELDSSVLLRVQKSQSAEKQC